MGEAAPPRERPSKSTYEWFDSLRPLFTIGKGRGGGDMQLGKGVRVR